MGGLGGGRAGRGVPGGSLGRNELASAAVVAYAGLDAIRYLRTTDAQERLLLMLLARRTFELHELMQRKLASEIVNTLGKALKR